jgi:hypothetical protein
MGYVGQTITDVFPTSISVDTATIATANISNQLTDANMSVGSIVQVIQGITSTTVTQTSTSYADTGLTASITPSSSSNKIFVMVNQGYRLNDSSYYAGASIKILRDTTTIYYAPSGTAEYFPYYESPQGSSNNVNVYNYFPLNYLDSPSTTSEVTYKTQQKSYGGASISTQNGGVRSTIILMEIVV